MADDDVPPAERAVDGRDDAAIRAAARARAPFYTGDAWDPTAGGPGTALLDLFGGLAGGVVERLDQVPHKHRATFVDALGFDRLAPQAARLPLSVQVSDGAGGPVHIPSGTRALAKATEPRSELTFAFEEGFEATPATVTNVVSVDPRLDHVGTYANVLAPDGTATLFGGPNAQRHRLYLGHPDLLTLEQGIVQVRAASTADAATLAALDWAYYGEIEDAEGWRSIPPTNVDAVALGDRIEVDAVATILDNHGFELTTDDRDAIERWLVATLLAGPGSDPTPPHVDPSRQPAVADLYAELARYVDRVYGDYPPETSTTLTGVTLEFDIEAPFVETTQFGTKSMWLRAILPADAAPPLAARMRGAALRNVTLAAGRPAPGHREGSGDAAGWMSTDAGDGAGDAAADSRAFPPDDLLANDVPLEVPTESDGGPTIRPFGTLPRVQDAFYIGSKEAFTKADQKGTVAFTVAERRDFSTHPPQVSWEYWNGSAWEYLAINAEPETAGHFAQPGAVTFSVPEDLAPRAVAGHEGHWIRARLVGRSYGDITFTPAPPEEPNKVEQRLDEIREPRLDSISVRYRAASTRDGDRERGSDSPPVSDTEAVPPGLVQKRPAQCYTDTNLAATTVDPTSRFQPFAPLPDDDQALYLGFDGPLAGGPLQVFVDLADVEYPARFHPRVRWDVSTADGWQRVSVRDGTDGLTERGVVRFTPPTETSPHDRFGATRHWLRARVTGSGGFVRAPYRRQFAAGETPPAERCGDHMPTTPPGDASAMVLPASDLIAPNTGWAANVRTIEGETLGSSDGTPDQQFRVASPPAREVTVWVDELATLSAGKRDRLAASSDVMVDRVGDPDAPDAFWVAWQAVDSFLQSRANDRHYVVDAVAGTVTFGDGTTGAIPPRGRDNIRVGYETGGGAAGNVAVGAVGELEGSLAFVDGVTNPLPADGGADAESTDDVLGRAPKELRDRNRAVAPEDYERLAKASARKLARARCLPGLGTRGTVEPGWVTVIVVPRTGERVPVPSASLKAQVTDGLAAAAPAAVLGDQGTERLVVRAPTYVEVTVEATLDAAAPDSLTALEAAANEALAAYLHPLTGGDAGDGWPFGELPCVSDCYGVLEGVPDVDHVSDIALHFDATGVSRTIGPGEEPPSVEPDVLVHSGLHDLDVVGGV